MKHRVKDNSNDRSYRVEVPQIVHAICENPYQLTLWLTIKMIAGETGECYLSTEDLATYSMMSAGKVSQERKFLIRNGLLEGELTKDPGYPQPVWHLSIPDLWEQNIKWRKANNSLKNRIKAKQLQQQDAKKQRQAKRQKNSLHLVKASPDEEGVSPDEEGVSPDETKNNHQEESKSINQTPPPKNSKQKTEKQPEPDFDTGEDLEVQAKMVRPFIDVFETNWYELKTAEWKKVSALARKPGSSLERWDNAVMAMTASKVKTVDRAIEIYEAGGTWEDMCRVWNEEKEQQNGQKPQIKLTSEQIALIEQYEAQ